MTKLSVALGNYPHTAALHDGSVSPDGYELEFVEIGGPIVSAFRRMVRTTEFDVSEMALTTYLVAKEHGKPFTAIPVFPFRGFPHGAIVVNTDGGITDPRQLEGKRIGVRAYTVTTGVWARGVLADQYGVDLDEVTWVVADEEHVLEYALPANVQPTPGADLGAMLAAGALEAGIGIGRPGAEHLAPLITDQGAKERAWADRGICPINHTVVIRDDILAEDRTLATALFSAFVAAKQPLLDRIAQAGELSEAERPLAAQRELLGPDPLPYGIDANRSTLEAVVAFPRSQHILTTDVAPEDVFVT